jgi:hypothetical protein
MRGARLRSRSGVMHGQGEPCPTQSAGFASLWRLMHRALLLVGIDDDVFGFVIAIGAV